jgi:hypothetical protein
MFGGLFIQKLRRFKWFGLSLLISREIILLKFFCKNIQGVQTDILPLNTYDR